MLHFSAGTTRLVISFGPWAFKIGKGKRGRAANRSEFGVWEKNPPSKRVFLCPSQKLFLNGLLLVAKRASLFRPGEMTDDLYIRLGIAWMREQPFDDAPFEPKDSDWGWIDGKPVAIDYALTQDFEDAYYPHNEKLGAE